MVIYNITYSVAKNINEQWLNWMKETHIREIIETGLYVKYQMVKLLDTDEDESTTYAIQFYAQTKGKHLEYIREHEVSFKLKSSRQWGNEVLGFGTLMEIVH